MKSECTHDEKYRESRKQWAQAKPNEDNVGQMHGYIYKMRNLRITTVQDRAVGPPAHHCDRKIILVEQRSKRLLEGVGKRQRHHCVLENKNVVVPKKKVELNRAAENDHG